MADEILSTEELLALQTTARLINVPIQQLMDQMPARQNMLHSFVAGGSGNLSPGASTAINTPNAMSLVLQPHPQLTPGLQDFGQLQPRTNRQVVSSPAGDYFPAGYTIEQINFDPPLECDDWQFDVDDLPRYPLSDMSDANQDNNFDDHFTEISGSDGATQDSDSFFMAGRASSREDVTFHSDASGLGSGWRNIVASIDRDVAVRPSDASSQQSNKRGFRLIEPKPEPDAGQPIESDVEPASSPINTTDDETPASARSSKRSKYNDRDRKETMITRQNKSCMRCRLQRNRCHPDPTNPKGPCLRCRQKVSRIGRMPCLRHIITDCTLFRTGLDFEQFYNEHPLVGPNHGDFHLDKTWTGHAPKVLYLSQDRTLQWDLDKESLPRVAVEFQEFVPPANDNSKDIKGRPMYLLPWGIPKPEAVVRELNQYIDRTQDLYINSHLERSQPLVWEIMNMAYRTTVLPVPNLLLKNTFRLWVGTRMIEGTWQCTGDASLIDQIPHSPFNRDRISPPSYLDFQFASLMIEKILMQLRRQVLKDFQALFASRKPGDWFVTFLVSFILLHNYERQMQFQKTFTTKRQMKVLYADKVLMRAINAGAKTILWHFHYCCKGQHPFRPEFDWSSPKTQRMAALTDEQIDFMKGYHELVQQNSEMLEAAHRSHDYHKPYWYTSQLFVPDWQPPETLEHPPPSAFA